MTTWPLGSTVNCILGIRNWSWVRWNWFYINGFMGTNGHQVVLNMMIFCIMHIFIFKNIVIYENRNKFLCLIICSVIFTKNTKKYALIMWQKKCIFHFDNLFKWIFHLMIITSHIMVTMENMYITVAHGFWQGKIKEKAYWWARYAATRCTPFTQQCAHFCATFASQSQ